MVPLVLAGFGGYLSYRGSVARASAALAEAAAVAEENTAKVLDTHLLVAARIDDLLAGLGDAAIRERERELHERLGRQIAELPQVAAAWAIDAEGRALVSARVYPVDRGIDHSGREDYRALRDGGVSSFIWALRARSLESGDFQAYFTVSRRRPRVADGVGVADGTPTDASGTAATAAGGFGGVVVVAVAGDYFASFYNSLLGGSAQYTASVVREDGTSLARYPEGAAADGPHDRLLEQAIAGYGPHLPTRSGAAGGAAGGVVAAGSPFGDGAVVAYKRLADYPVYVAIGRTKASILHDWGWSVAGYAAIGVPAALGFMLLSLTALHRTRREQLALAQARDAVAQRAAVEAQLHQARQDRMVDLAATNEELTQTVDALQTAKRLAEAASKAKSDFLANISHELRTPLNAIIGFSDLMRNELLGPIGNPSYREYAGDIHFSGTHLLAIISDLLDVVRHESGRLDLREEEVEIDAAVNEALRLVAPQARQGQVALTWRVPPAAPPLYCDRIRLRQMLLNILSNAIKFTGARGSVQIDLELADDP